MGRQVLKLEELSIEQLQADPHHPRREEEEGRAGKKKNVPTDRLLTSMQLIGIQQPLVVCEAGVKNRYTILDGHRRYQYAKDLQIPTVPCCIQPKLLRKDFAFRQFEIQYTRKEWKPNERSEAIMRIMQMHKLNQKEAAEYLGVSRALVSTSLKLLEVHSDYKKLMADYGLPPTYQYEFVLMHDKIQKVGELEISDIILILFEKVRSKIIDQAKQFRTIGHIFKEFLLHEKELQVFLRTPHMRVEELVERTKQPPMVLYGKKFLQEFAAKVSKGERLVREEKQLCVEIKDALQKLTG